MYTHMHSCSVFTQNSAAQGVQVLSQICGVLVRSCQCTDRRAPLFNRLLKDPSRRDVYV